MKTKTVVLLSALALGVSSLLVSAENTARPDGRPGPGNEGGPGPGHRPPPPVIMVLDANHDGVLDAEEIANASKALLTLDANKDGQLTQDELRPPRREGQGEGAPDGMRPPQGPPGNN